MAKTTTAIRAVDDEPAAEDTTPEEEDDLTGVPDSDLDAAQLAVKRRQLNAAVVTLEWQGQTFTIPKRRGRWPTDAAREFGRNNHLEAVIQLIGEDAYARLKAACPVVDDINEFADYAGEKIKTECIP